MKYVYLVCSRSESFERFGFGIKPFKDSEIHDEIVSLRSRPLSSSLNVLHCYSSSVKAQSLCDRLNCNKMYRYCQFIHKDSVGHINRINLIVYDYFVVKRVLN